MEAMYGIAQYANLELQVLILHLLKRFSINSKMPLCSLDGLHRGLFYLSAMQSQ